MHLVPSQVRQQLHVPKLLPLLPPPIPPSPQRLSFCMDNARVRSLCVGRSRNDDDDDDDSINTTRLNQSVHFKNISIPHHYIEYAYT